MSWARAEVLMTAANSIAMRFMLPILLEWNTHQRHGAGEYPQQHQQQDDQYDDLGDLQEGRRQGNQGDDVVDQAEHDEQDQDVDEDGNHGLPLKGHRPSARTFPL